MTSSREVNKIKVYLNGNSYELKAGTGVTRSPLEEWRENIRLDGQQQRKDRSDISSWAIDRWANGLCLERINVDVVAHKYRLWDVENCDTRWESYIPLSPAFNPCTIVPSRGDLALAFDWMGDIYFAETTATINVANCFKFTPPNTLGSFRYLMAHDSYEGGSLNAVKAFGGNIVMVAKDRENAMRCLPIPTLGYADDMQDGRVVGSHTSYFSQLADLGGTLHLLYYEDEAKQMRFYLGDQTLDLVGTPVASINTILGSYMSPMAGNGLNMFANLPEGVFDFDLTPALVVDTSRAKDRNCAMTLFRQNILFKNKKSLLEYDGTDINHRGYDKEDGLPSDKWGEITAMIASEKFAFCAVKSGTYSHILTIDDNYSWGYYARVPTAGLWVREMFLSDSPDAIDRLWLIFGNHSYPGYFLEPMVNPLQAGTYGYVPTGYFTAPQHDGGMIEELGGYYDQKVTADGLGGNQKITCLYGLDGDAPVSTLGVVGTTSDSLTFGSPSGVEGHRIQPKFILHRGSNTGSTPAYRSAIIHYLKIPKVREVFEFTLDLRETYKKHAGAKSLESIIGSLNYERSTRTLLPFAYGQVATRWVKVLDMPSVEEVTNEEVFAEEREGEVSLKVSELI